MQNLIYIINVMLHIPVYDLIVLLCIHVGIYHGIKYCSPSNVICLANTGVFRQIWNKILHFSVTKSGYQQPNSCRPNNFHVTWLSLNHTLILCNIFWPYNCDTPLHPSGSEYDDIWVRLNTNVWHQCQILPNVDLLFLQVCVH